MNRNEMLEKSLPTWINQPVREIIILDWSSKESLKPIVDANQNGKIILARINDKQYFNKPRALNTAIRIASGEYIFSIDSDVKLHENILLDHEIKDNVFYTGRWWTQIMGTFIASKNNILKVNGFNEFFNGWAVEDRDMYNRLERLPMEKAMFKDGYLTHIDHGDELRTENYKIKDATTNRNNNIDIMNKGMWDNTIKQESQNVTLYYPDGSTKDIYI